jgi:hypothetical protein
MTTQAVSIAQHHHHQHENGQDHVHAESYAHVQGGPTVLDIGGEIGAMIVTLSPAAEGTELHLRSTHEPPISIHTGVWRRGFGDRVSTTAVFAELVEGSYWVLDSSGTDLRQVEIRGGALTSIDLRD